MIDTLITDHRALYQADLQISRLVQRQPPTSLDLNTGVLHQEEATQIGMNMSSQLLRLLGHPEGYGTTYPWLKALWMLRVECRRAHHSHRGEDRVYWRGSLCHEAVRLVVIGPSRGPLTPPQAAQVLRLDNIDDLLRRTFRFIEQTIDDFRSQAERRAKEDEGTALTCKCGHPWSRHDDPATMFRCTACVCSRYNADSRKAA